MNNSPLNYFDLEYRSRPVARPWHPYPAPDPTQGGPRRFRQGRLRGEKNRMPRNGVLPDASNRFLATLRGGGCPRSTRRPCPRPGGSHALGATATALGTSHGPDR